MGIPANVCKDSIISFSLLHIVILISLEFKAPCKAELPFGLQRLSQEKQLHSCRLLDEVGSC